MITLSQTQDFRGVSGTAAAVTCSIFGDLLNAAADNFTLLFQGQLPNAAAILLAASPGQQLLIKSILLSNTTNADVSGVQFFSGGSVAVNQLVNLRIPALGSATWTDSKGWTIYDANGVALGANLALPNQANDTLLANISGGVAPPIPVHISDFLDASIGTSEGLLLTRGSGGWVGLAAGTAGFFLQSTGPGALLAYAAAAGLTSENTFKNVQAVTPCVGSIAGSVNIDLSNFSASTGLTPAASQPVASNTLILTATANITALSFSNAVDGAVYNIYLVENATGGWTWSLPGNFSFGAAGAPSLTTTPNAVNLISAQALVALAIFRCAANDG